LIIYLAGQDGTALMRFFPSDNLVYIGNLAPIPVDPPTNLALHGDPEADTPLKLAASYITQLGAPTTAQDLIDASHRPEVIGHYTADSNVEIVDASHANVYFHQSSAGPLLIMALLLLGRRKWGFCRKIVRC